MKGNRIVGDGRWAKAEQQRMNEEPSIVMIICQLNLF